MWEPGKYNLADYPTKHHAASHHRIVRGIYLFVPGQSPIDKKECIKILDRLQCPRMETLQELDDSCINQVNPGTTPENPRMPSAMSTTNRNRLPTTNKPAINALGNITRQLAQQHTLIAHHAIIQQPIADHTITSHRLHRKLQYLANVLKSRRDTLFSHKMI